MLTNATTRVLLLLTLASLSACNGKGTTESPADMPPPAALENTTAPRWVKQHTPHANIALVFVHGIFGDTVGTWKGDGPSFFDLIAQDPKMGPKVDMYAFGYPSNMIRQGSFGIDEAANTLYKRLDTAGVLDYPAVVFINHSMGGLVVMHMLINHREMFPKVPAVVFFSTPQSGAEISNIAKHVSGNEALLSMLPGDSNIYIRSMNDSWKSLDANTRPRVDCAYEKKDTGPFRIVDWASATRFCDGTAQAISANHITIVKPDSADSDSFLVVQSTLKPLLDKVFEPKLATPDFQIEDGQPFVTIDNPYGKQDVHIRNSGGGLLRYSLDQWPNSLYVWPGTDERTLPGEATEKLQIALANGASGTEYKFVLRSNATDPMPVRVRVKNLEKIRANQEALAGEVLNALSGTLNDPQQAAALAEASPDQTREKLVDVVRGAVAKRDPDLLEVGQWVLTAELLTSVNWPELGATALRRAEKVDPAILSVGSIKQLAASTAGLSGQQAVTGVPALPPESLDAWVAKSKTPFTSDRSIQAASNLSATMLKFPALKASALSLEGDIARAKGDPGKAVQSYKEMAIIKKSPSNEMRMRAMESAVGNKTTMIERKTPSNSFSARGLAPTAPPE